MSKRPSTPKKRVTVDWISLSSSHPSADFALTAPRLRHLHSAFSKWTLTGPLSARYSLAWRLRSILLRKSHSNPRTPAIFRVTKSYGAGLFVTRETTCIFVLSLCSLFRMRSPPPSPSLFFFLSHDEIIFFFKYFSYAYEKTVSLVKVLQQS